MAAQRRRHGPAVALRSAEMIADPAQFVGGGLARQGVEPVTDARPRRRRLAEVLDEYLARAGLEIVGFQAMQVEGFHP